MLGSKNKGPPQSLISVFKLISQGMIYLPTPLRLLRIGCGKKCENAACIKNTRVTELDSDFGLFMLVMKYL